MWRPAIPADDERIVAMCLEFYGEDPPDTPVAGPQVQTTLQTLRREPHRGLAVTLDVDGALAGYALLIPFWSNERGGEVCEVDELYVAPGWRGRGWAARLFEDVEGGRVWPRTPRAIELGVHRSNQRAHQLYRKLGFRGDSIALHRPCGGVP